MAVQNQQVVKGATTPAPKDKNENADALALITGAIEAMPDDKFTPELRPLLRKGARAVAAIDARHWEAADALVTMMRPSGEMIRSAADAAASQVSPYGPPGSRQDLLEGQAQARQAIVRGAQRAAVDAVLRTSGPKITDAATNAQTALIAADKAVSWCAAQWSGPAALLDDVSIETLHRIAATAQQIKSQKTPMSWALAYLRQAVENADERTLSIFTQAAREVALDFRDTPPAKLAQRYTFEQTASMDNERATAFRVLRALDDVREQTQPESLATSVRVVGALEAVFTTLAGYDARGMSSVRFAERWLKGDGSASPSRDAARFAIDAGMVARFLPPADPPSGWSAPHLKGEGGFVIRVGRDPRNPWGL